MLFKRVDKERTERPRRPIDVEITDGSEEEGEYIDDKLYEYNLPFLDPKHEYIKINRKLVDENGRVVAAVMAGVSGTDAGWIWRKICGMPPQRILENLKCIISPSLT